MPMVYENAAGTATVKLTIPRNRRDVLKKTIEGCFVKKEANFKAFIEKYIDPSADRNKYERSDYLLYCCVSDVRKVVTKAVIKYEKPSKGWGPPTQKTKTCTVEQPLIITFDGHFFLCCDSDDLGKESKFLSECSKEVRIDQDLGTRQNFYGIGVEGHCLQFIFLDSNIKQLQNHVYKVKYKNEYEKLLEVGPLLLGDKKTVVGCYRKTAVGNYGFEIDIFGKQDTAPLSLPPGHQGEPVADSLPSEAPERDRLTDQALPGPSRDNQQSVRTFKYDQLRFEAIRQLQEYITFGRGTLTEIKDRFYGYLKNITERERGNIDDVPKLVKTLEDLGVIGADNVKLLRMLAETLDLQEMQRKVEEFEVAFPRKGTGGHVYLKAVLSVLGIQLTAAGAVLMFMYATNPEELENVVQPFVGMGSKLLALLGGSVVFVLEVPSILAVKQLWQSYMNGSLKENLKNSFNKMENITELSQGKEVDLELTIDEEEYREVLWDLIQLDVKGESVKSTKRRQRRHSVSCERDIPEELTVGEPESLATLRAFCWKCFKALTSKMND